MRVQNTWLLLLIACLTLFGRASQAQGRFVQFINASPDTALSVVDLWLDTVKVADSLAFRHATSLINIPSQSSKVVAVTPAGSNDTSVVFLRDTLEADTASMRWMFNGFYSSGYPNFQPATFTAIPLRWNAPAEEYSHLSFYNGSPDFGALAMRLNEENAEPLVDSVAFHLFNAAADTAIESLNYHIELLDSNQDVQRSYEMDLGSRGLSDSAMVLIVTGFHDRSANFNGPGLQLSFVGNTGGELASFSPSFATVQWIHNSYDASLDKLDLFLDASQVINNLSFRHATGPLQVSAGVSHALSIAPESSTGIGDTIASANFSFEADASYYIMISGTDQTSSSYYQPLNIAVRQARTSAPVGSQVSLLVFHGAPDLGSIELVETDLLNAPIISSLEYGAFSSYEHIAAAQYRIALKTQGNLNPHCEYAPDLSDTGGSAVLWMVSGIGDTLQTDSNLRLGIWELPANGGALKELDKITGLPEVKGRELKLYPNPSSGALQIRTSENIEWVEVFDATGRRCARWDQFSAPIDLSDHPEGVYVVHVQTDSGLYIQRVSIAR